MTDQGTGHATFPEVLEHRVDGNQAQVSLTLCPDLVYFQGHFPGQPVLPGVAQLHFAITLGMELLRVPGQFAGMRGLKFKRALLPGQQVELMLDWKETRSELSFSYRVKGETASSGTILFAA